MVFILIKESDKRSDYRLEFCLLEKENGTFSAPRLLEQSLTLARAKCLLLTPGEIIMIHVYCDASCDFICL